MSTLARPFRAADAPRERPAREAVTLRWTIARAAAAGALPDLVGPTGPPIVLEWRLQTAEHGRVSGGARLVDGVRSTDVLAVLERGPGTWLERQGPTVHIDLPGILSVSVQMAPGGVRLLYARTGLLAAWGIPGGRYDVTADGHADARARAAAPQPPDRS